LKDDSDDDKDSVATNESKDSDEESSNVDSSDEEEDNEDETLQLHTRKRKRETTSPKRQFTFQQLKSHKKALSNAWLAVLKLPLPPPALKSALQFLPSNVIPHVPNPLLFADFFMQAYNYTGVIGVLALDGLFVLMTEYGLEYPLFYTNLYRLVQPNMLYVKHRTRFFELLTRCLCRNEMLPAHLVAAFVKRLLRSALNAPPPGILFSLALVANLLRKHPECAALIHRSDEMKEDPFDAHTHDPSQSRGEY
jgi:U3 small nucleolar RNA-associated protein 19